MRVSIWRVVSVPVRLVATLVALSLLGLWKHLTSNHPHFYLPPSAWRVMNVPFRLLAALKALFVLWKCVSYRLTSSHKYFRSFQAHSNSVVYHFPLACLSFFVVVSFIYLQLVTYKLIDRRLCTALGGSHPSDSMAYSDSMLRGRHDSLPPFSSVKEELLPSRNLIVRAVYYDPRPRDGHIDATVFLIEVHKHLLGNRSIVGCGVGNMVRTDLNIRLAKNSIWVHKNYPHLTHDVAMVDCFDLPVKAGLKAFLWYTSNHANSHTADLIRVESEHPSFVPALKQTHNDDDVKIVTCVAIVRDFPPYFSEFLRYQKYLGVDHIYMTGEDSFIRNGGFQSDEYVLRALHEGYISFTFWHPWLNEEHIFYHSQMLAHQDCIYRFQGTYDYAFIIDSDDFFVPLVPDAKSLDYYVDNYCHFGACIFPWIEFYPDCGVQWERLGQHGNVTNTLVSHVSKRRLRAGKSIHRVSAILDAGTHKPQVLLDGYRWMHIPPSVAYVAHVRRNRQPPGGMEAC